MVNSHYLRPVKFLVSESTSSVAARCVAATGTTKPSGGSSEEKRPQDGWVTRRRETRPTIRFGYWMSVVFSCPRTNSHTWYISFFIYKRRYFTYILTSQDNVYCVKKMRNSIKIAFKKTSEVVWATLWTIGKKNKNKDKREKIEIGNFIIKEIFFFFFKCP